MEFYKHEDKWSNRLILGDSLLVMTSLIEKEPKVAGHVQMIYYDPPYGINYSSNFQSGFKPSGGNNIEYRPEAITAFRDTWEYGIHSYLSMIRKQLVAAHEMLADTGSIFLQISEINVHRVRLLLDEIFGAENFMWDIIYQTKTGAGSKYPSNCDYILWYAKDKKLLKNSDNLHQLYLDRENDSLSSFNRVRLSDSSLIPAKDGEIPKNGRLCRLMGLFSQHPSTTGRSDPHTFPNGKTINVPPSCQWRLGGTALNKLLEKNRLYFTDNNVSMFVYPEDYPVKLSNIWKGMSIVGEKIYDVQTKTTVIERCMLMCTNPGDLVMDLTCGSGVTPYCAEKYGRRWIATDVSKLSIAITTARLQTAVFDWYKLVNENLGICGGLKYEEFTKLSAGALSETIEPEIEYRYEKPIIEKKRLRITGPFTVESVPSTVIISQKDQIDDSTRETWFKGIEKAGINTNNGKLRFEKIETIDKKNSAIHYIGTTLDDKQYAISFGPLNSPMGNIQVETALREKRPYHVDGIVFVASIFGPEAKDMIWNSLKDDNILGAEANSDMLMPDLKNKESDSLFVQIGRPRINVEKRPNNKYVIKLSGYDYFDITKGKLTSEGTDNVAVWMLDVNYDGYTFRPSQIFFPNTDHIYDFKKKLKKTLKADDINMEKLEQFRGIESLEFTPGERKKICIKTVDMQGREAKYSEGVEEW